MTPQRGDIPGARESNAGDEFHILWALGRILRMLDPRETLHLVVMEGVSPIDTRRPAPATLLLGADLTEYYGGTGIADADRVVVSQLKHSERRPTTPWSVARLVQAGSRGQPGTIQHLADAYRHFKLQIDRDQLLVKLTIQLVSNQPAQAALSALVNTVQTNLAAMPAPARMVTLTRGLTSAQVTALERLKTATRLGVGDFGDFIRVLRLDDLGAPSRRMQQNQIVQTLGRHLLTGMTAGARALFDLVRRQALPSAEPLTLTPEAVLAELGVARHSALFPFPTRFALPADPVTTPDASRLAAVVGADRSHIAAHGDAGVGKTTTLATLEEHLPAGSVVITYDCFGAGQYLDPTEARHLAKPAVLQIVNEIALRCGTPLLLTGGDDELLLWQHLRHVLRVASETLSSTDARLVIAIDAADNAAIAGQHRTQPTFIEDLWAHNLPDRVHVLMTCRTHRRSLIAVPEDAAEVELFGFDAAASATHLRNRFPDADDAECARFHERSGGNPRSQFYVLDASRTDPVAGAAEAADAAESTPLEIFADLLKAATKETASPDSARRHLADLICLTRPVPLKTLAAVTGLSVDAATAFCHGLAPGAILETEGVTFRDEDFETYLRDQVTELETVDSHHRLADHFMARRHLDSAAATACAEHLYLAGRFQELIDLAVVEGQPEAVADLVGRLHVYFRRLELAMQVAREPQWRAAALRLTLLAATASATNQAVAAIVRKRPDLAMTHGDPSAVAVIYEEAHSDPWRAALHFRVAHIRAMGDDREGTLEELRLADAWMQRWARLPDDERPHRELDATDVAAGAAAVYLLFGPEEAYREICRWRPLSFRLEIADALVETLAPSDARLDLAPQLDQLPVPEWVEARLLATLFRHGEVAHADVVSDVAERTLRALPNRRRRRQPWATSFMELIAATTGDPALVRLWADAFAPITPTYAPHGWQGLGDWAPKVRYEAMTAIVDGRTLDVDALRPPQMEDAEGDDYRTKQHKEAERRRFNGMLKPTLGTFIARAAALLGRPDTDAALTAVRAQIAQLAANPRVRDDVPDITREWALPAIDALAAASMDTSEDVTALEAAIWARGADMAMGLIVELGGRLARYAPYRDMALRWLDRAAVATVDSAEPATDRADRLLTITSIVDRHDHDLASGYYRAAVEAAEGLDDEGAGVLRVHTHMAASLSGSSDARVGALAERLARSVEHYQPYVSDGERLPWRETIHAVTLLHPPSGAALLSRWEHEGLLTVDDSVRVVLVEAARSMMIAPADALALLRLSGESSYPIHEAVELLDMMRISGDRVRLATALESVSKLVRRDLPTDRRVNACRAIVAWATPNGLAPVESVRELDAIVRYAESLPPPAHRGQQSYETRSADRGKKIRQIISDVRHDDATQLRLRLDELHEEWASEADIEELLVRFGTTRSPAQRRALLDALTELPANHRTWRGYGTAVLRALSRLLQDWHLVPAVGAWTRDKLPMLVRDRFRNLVAYEQVADNTLPIVMALPGIGDPGTLVVESLAPILSQLDTSQLHSIARALASVLPEPERLEALDWSLKRLEDAPPPVPALPDTPSDAVVELLMAMFGHPDSALRWRAAHAAREIVITTPSYADAIVDLLDRRSCGPYVPNDREHLWISAGLWALMVIGRVVDDEPGSFTDLFDRLTVIALDRQFPHASRRELARRAALRMIDHLPAGADEPTRARLTASNIPASTDVDCERRFGSGWFETREDERFSFNSMDTRPYWFEPLGRLFGLSSVDVERRVERWVVDQFHFTNEQVRADPSWHSRRYRYEETQNDHGALPRVEKLRTYLEFHGMLLVAGELIDEGIAVSANPYDEPFDPWEDWLRSYVDNPGPGWGSDHRTPPPQRPATFGVIPPTDTWRDRTPSDFDAELLSPDGLELVVDSYTEIHAHDRSATSFVNTALVSPETATALLAALQTCSDPSDFRLPEERRGDWGNDFEIDEPGFRLLGWILEQHQDDVGLEKHDSLRRISLTFTRPGTAFVDHHQLAPLVNGRTYVNGAGRTVAHTEHWVDIASDGGDRVTPFTSGHQTWVLVSELLDFLAAVRMDLICEVRIARQFDRRNRSIDSEDDDSYETGRSRIYLLRRNGELSTLDGSRRLGSADRDAAGLGHDD